MQLIFTRINELAYPFKRLFLAERYDETIGLITKWIHHYPPRWSLHQLLAIAYLLLGPKDDKKEFEKVLKIDQNIAGCINQSLKYALNKTTIAFVQLGDSVQSRGLMVAAHSGRSDRDQRFITQKDILESEILMILGYVLIKECCHTVCNNLFNKNGIYEL